jgi:hypothetical protein
MGKNEQIVWYEDDEIKIIFNKVPQLNIRYTLPWLKKEEVKEINKKPFICNSELLVSIEDKTEQEYYDFRIPEGYTWDGATIPRIFWRMIGSKTDNRFLVPSLIHDVLCENHDYIDGQRYLSTIIFERLLYVSKVNPVSRWMMKHSVDNAQKIIGGW